MHVRRVQKQQTYHEEGGGAEDFYEDREREREAHKKGRGGLSVYIGTVQRWDCCQIDTAL